jgi:hypothetical protein
MPFSTKLFQEIYKLEPDLKTVMLELLSEIERNREESINRKEFLAFAQKTDENFLRVWSSIEKLTEAQKKSEERLTRVEKVVEELAEAQKRTEQRLEELAEAQKKTEDAIKKLTIKLEDMSDELGGISNTIGYGLEDKVYSVLKKVIKEDFNIDVNKLYRKNIVYSTNKFDEINIYGEGIIDGEKIYIIGECKAQFGPNDVSKYLNLLKRVEKHLVHKVTPLTVAYQYHPLAEQKLQEEKIRYYWSYELIETP